MARAMKLFKKRKKQSVAPDTSIGDQLDSLYDQLDKTLKNLDQRYENGEIPEEKYIEARERVENLKREIASLTKPGAQK